MRRQIKRLGRSAVCAALCLLLTTASLSPAAYAAGSRETLEEQINGYQQRILEREEKLEQLKQDQAKQNDYILALQQQADDLEGQTRAIEEQIGALNAEIKGYDERIEALAAEIAALEEKIAARQAETDKTYEQLRERLRAMYITGGISRLEFFFGAKDLSDFLNRVELMARTTKHDKALIDSINAQLNALHADQDAYQQNKAALDQERAEYEAARLRQQTTLDQLKASQAETERKKQELTSYVEQLDRDSVLLYELNAHDLDRIEAAQAEVERIIAENASKGDGTPPPIETPDNGQTPDGGQTPDEGQTPDGGQTPDEGQTPDGGQTPDEGTVVGEINPSTGFCYPLPELLPGALGYVSDHYGPRTHPITGKYKMHTGVDLSGSRAMGRPIVAVYPGTVIYAGSMEGYGNVILIDHGNGLITLYAHCSRLIAAKGQAVKRGQEIAKIGNTGVSGGPHCHFEVRKGQERINPEPYLPYDIPNRAAW